MSEKNDAFHRLAAKRVETITDAMRIFSNLSGPSYEWSPEEVLTYIGQIDEARDAIIARFQETKRWRENTPSMPGLFVELTPDQQEAALDDDGADEPPAPSKPVETREQRRNRTIQELLEDPEPLAATIVLQREVIERLQAQIDGMKS